MKLNNLLILLVWLGLQSLAVAAESAPKVPTTVPGTPIDTLDTPDPETKVVLYSNNTWKYLHTRENVNAEQADILSQNWVTDKIFAYRNVEFDDIPNEVQLKLAANSDEFHTPIFGKVFSKFGPRGRRNHYGVDIPLKMYEPIYAVFDGRVRYARYNTGGYGNLVIIRHNNGLETYSAHLSRHNVEEGDYVKAGQIIGFGGSTGRSRGPHLHFEFRYCDRAFDPEFLVDFENGSLKYQTFVLEKRFFNNRSRASEILEDVDDDDYSMLAQADGKVPTAKTVPKDTPQAATSKAVYHTIRSGDVLGRIAKRYGVSVDQICRLNNITRNSILRPGRKLRIK